jgi:hypothetical protein
MSEQAHTYQLTIYIYNLTSACGITAFDESNHLSNILGLPIGYRYLRPSYRDRLSRKIYIFIGKGK